MRFFRYDDMDTRFVAGEPVVRDELLRELVDGLPKDERHMVERVYFGGVSIAVAAAEIGLGGEGKTRAESERDLTKARTLLRRAKQKLYEALSETD